MNMDTNSNAVMSDCGKYRYRLSRKWSNAKPCLFIMLNPSKADAVEDDPTIRRCINFAKSWGCGELIVVNLFSVRATDPQDMMKADDPVGPENMRYVKEAADYVERGHPCQPNMKGIVVCAWGAHGTYMNQAETVLGWLDDAAVTPMALLLTKNDQPRHPLYLKSSLEPAPLYSFGALREA